MMYNLQTLIGYEYKKIAMRKSTWIALIIAVLLTLLSCFAAAAGTVYVEGKPVYSHYEEMTTDRSYARALAGRKVDPTLISEMQQAYSKVPDVPLYSATEEYQTYARPYSTIFHLVRGVSKDVANLDGDRYYELRNEKIITLLEEKHLSDLEIKKHMDQNEKVTTPFVFQYIDGFERILIITYSLGISITFLIAICLAPIFANEYSDKTDQLILTSRLGKNTAILAKQLTGIIFGAMISILLLTIEIIPTLLFYGFDGWNAPLQLFNVTSTAPLTLLKCLLILCGLVIISSVLIACICMYLSSKLKSAFAVIIVVSTFTILCMLLQVPTEYRILFQLVSSLPANIMSIQAIVSDYFFVIFNQCFTIYQVIPVIYIVLSVILAIFGYRSFKYHQVG